MKTLSFSLISSLVAAVTGLALVIAIGVSAPVKTAYACTGGWGSFDEYAVESQAVAVVEVIKAGDNVNRASPLPSSTPAVPLPPPPLPTPQPGEHDLTGIGAELRVTGAIAGNLLEYMEVDVQLRRSAEEQIRRYEAGSLILCAPTFGMHRYEAGGRYLVFLRHDEQWGWSTSVQFRMDGDDVLVGRPGVSTTTAILLVISKAVRDAYFGGVPAVTGDDPDSADSMWFLDVDRVELDRIAVAVRGLRSGGPPAPPVIIQPPVVGNAGLR